MKKALFVLFVLGAVLTGCGNDVGLGSNDGLLTVYNINREYSYIVFVYLEDKLPITYSEYFRMTDEKAIAAGIGNSPFKLSWSDGIKSGNYLITVSSGSRIKMVVGSFNDIGTAEIDWKEMKDVP